VDGLTGRDTFRIPSIQEPNHVRFHLPPRRPQDDGCGRRRRLRPTAFAQTDGALRLVVTFPPGGSTDITARIIQRGSPSAWAAPSWWKTGRAPRARWARSSSPDRRRTATRCSLCFDTHAINPIAKKNLPYDTFRDFVGVSLVVRFPLVIGASMAAPGKDLKEFLAAAKQAPGKFSYASTGVGSMNHLVAEDLKRQSASTSCTCLCGGGRPCRPCSEHRELHAPFLRRAQGEHRRRQDQGAGRHGQQAPGGPAGRAHGGGVGFPGFEAYSWIGIFAPRPRRRDGEEAHGGFPGRARPPEVAKKLTDADSR